MIDEQRQSLQSKSEIFQGDREKYVATIFDQIESDWETCNGDRALFTKRLQSLGGSLWDQLFDGKFRETLWRIRGELASVQVFSEEPFIPWELVLFKDPDGNLPAKPIFLAEKGLVRWSLDTLARP